MGLLDKRRDSPGPSGAGGEYVDANEDRKCYPQLVDFLSRPSYLDGSRRVTGTVTVYVEGGCLKASLNDRDAGLVGFTTLDGLTTVLDELEGKLVAETVDWRVTKQEGRRR